MTLIECKGGFPRIYVNIENLESKEEKKGFKNNKLKSIQEIIKMQKKKIKKSEDSDVLHVGGSYINGIPIDIIIGI